MNVKFLLAASAAVAVAAAALWWFWPFGTGAGTLRLPGIVEIQEVRLGSKVGGRVAKVAVAEGDVVEPGQPLVYFEVPELEKQRDQLRARYEIAVQEYEKAKNGPRVQEVQAARATAAAALARYERMKAGFREEEKRAALEEAESAEAEFKQADQEFKRVAGLVGTKSVAVAEYDLAWGIRERTRGRAMAARTRSDMLKAGNRVEDVEMTLQEWKQAQANLALLEAGTRDEDKYAAKARLDEAKAKLDEAEVNLKEQVVYAQEKAVVEVLAVRKGDLVPPHQPVLRVLRAEDLWVKIYVPETELGKIRLRQQVEVRVDSYPDRRFAGEVVQVASISEFTPRNVQSAEERRYQVFAVKVRVADPQGVFKAGMAAEVVIHLRAAP